MASGSDKRVQQRTYEPPHNGEAMRIFFRYGQANARTEYLPHSHRWGQVIFVKSNVLEMQVEGERLLTPASMPVWIPAGQIHASYNHRQSSFCTLNIASSLCHQFPERACLLRAGPVAQAIIDNIAARDLLEPETEEDWRLSLVLIDQLRIAEAQPSYLPATDDKYLAPILRVLEENPADNTTLAQWARRVYTTERTLSRRCQALLGITFSEWRQRLRFLHAVSRLEQGQSVQEVAMELGYSSASAFIVMFHQQCGTTPERYRSRL